jgi:hypothetical protein
VDEVAQRTARLLAQFQVATPDPTVEELVRSLAWAIPAVEAPPSSSSS